MCNLLLAVLAAVSVTIGGTAIALPTGAATAAAPAAPAAARITWGNARIQASSRRMRSAAS